MKTNPNHLHQLDGTSSPLRRGRFLLLAIFGAGWLTTNVHADALTGYYTAIAAGDPDVGGAIYTLNNGMVMNQLGPNGLPVLSSTGISVLGATPDMNATTHELLWWSPGLDPNVSYDSVPVQVDSNPMTFGYPNPWYVTGQSSDQNYYRSVHWKGTFNMAAAGPISLSLSVDDDAWLFIDGNMITEGHYSNPTANPTMSAGTHSIDIFYADRIPVYDAFYFSSSVAMSPVPEPGAITLFAAGVFCLLWRRRQQQVAG